MAINDTKVLGASGTNIFSDEAMGVLGTLSGSPKRAQQAVAFAQQLYPDTPKADPYEAAFQFFAEMGRQASQPGATAFGAAVGSMGVPLDYLNAKKKEAKETDKARMQTALQLAPSLKPAAGKVTYRPATEAELKRYGATSGQMGSDGKFYDLSKTSASGKPTKPFNVKINDTAAFATAFPNVELPEDNIVPLRADQLSTLPVGSYALVESETGDRTSSLTDYKPASPEGLAKFKAAYPDVILSPEQEAGTVPISLPNRISNDPNLLGAFVKFKEPRAGSQYERIFASVNDIGTRLAAFNADNTLPPVSQKEINEYAANYQKLIVGGEFTELVDGQEVTRRKPGIDLSETTNLPIPAGLDLEEIIKQRSQKFDQDQTKSATFGSKMLYTEGIVLNVMAQGYVPSVEDIAKIKLMDSIGLGTIGLSTEARQYHNAAQAWVAAQLRDESGAAIGPTEYANALRDYFPQVGDDSDTINNKRALREATVTGMINSSGDAFDVMYPGARQYLKYNDGETTYDILNSQGYANELLAKARLGRTINFKSTISVMDLDELILMAQNPNRESLYTPEMLEILAEEIARRN